MTAILANTITADLGLIPGLAIVGPLCGLPLSVMAAVIERPFLTAGGPRRDTVWWSIQANFVSLLVGYPIVILIAILHGLLGDAILLLWPFAAVAISTLVEQRYINWRVTAGGRVSFKCALSGNAVSALICILLLFPVSALDTMSVKTALRPYQTPLSIVLGAFCAGAVIVAFVMPRRPLAPAPAAEAHSGVVNPSKPLPL